MSVLFEDERAAQSELLARIKAHLPEFESLLRDMAVAEERGFLLLYLGSPNVYDLQNFTEEAARLFREVASHNNCRLDRRFEQILRKGTSKLVDLSDNSSWLHHTRPILEAFLHAKFFIAQHVHYGSFLETPPEVPPLGWSTLLVLYELM